MHFPPKAYIINKDLKYFSGRLQLTQWRSKCFDLSPGQLPLEKLEHGEDGVGALQPGVGPRLGDGSRVLVDHLEGVRHASQCLHGKLISRRITRVNYLKVDIL